MIALFRKELGELVGLFVLSLFSVGFVAWAHGTIPLGLHSGFEVVDFLIEDITIISALAAFAAGHSRFGPEYQQKTIAFLDALPTSRHRVFLVKLIAGALPTLITTVAIGGLKAWALSAHPLANATPVGPLVLAITVNIGLILYAHYATGLALSWFGAVGWQALLVTGFCLLTATMILPSLAPWYPLFEGAVNVAVVGGQPVFPWGPPVLWALWTLGGITLAWVLFLGPGDRIAHGPWWIRGIAQVLVYTPPVLLIFLLVLATGLTTAISLPDLVRTTYRAETEHFRFLATWQNKSAADELIGESEVIRELIVDRFGTEGPPRLDVELTGASEHLGGVFVPGKLQLRSDADGSVLAHELSHAWSHHLGAPSDANAWRFFEEGLATFHEGAVSEPTAQAATPGWGAPQSDWFLAPVHGRRQRAYSPDEDYSVGAIWARALVDAGSMETPTCVIRAASKTPRGETDGLPWWSSLLTQCDLTLSEVIAAYEAALPRDVRVPALIAWHGGLAGGYHHIRFTEPPEGVDIVVCMARSDHRTARTQYTMSFAHRDEACKLSASGLDPHRFELIVGHQEPGGSWRMGEWRTITVPR